MLMKFSALAVFAICVFAQPPPPHNKKGTNWAVLIAGSNGYYNYRHQSDICHAYQILRNIGKFPEENIIVMMYDDIAFNENNPHKGNIINHPNGPNVYPGVNKDYTGNEVTAKNFLKVLRGDMPQGKKSLKNATEDDDIFIYFADHGASGLIAMPVGEPLYAKDLMNTLRYMHNKKMYHQLVFYMEACESGSMFDKLLPNDMNIFATTAANSDESSYACYWDDSRQTYLGDVYSVRWMEDSDKYLGRKDNTGHLETLEKQFIDVRKETNTSHVQQFGNMTMDAEPTTFFQEFKKFHASHSGKMLSSTKITEVVSSRDIVLKTLERRMMSTNDLVEQGTYKVMIEDEKHHRFVATMIFKEIVRQVVDKDDQHPWLIDQFLTKYTPPTKWNCLKMAYRGTEEACGRFSDFSLKFVRALVNLCESFETHQVTAAITKSCENVDTMTKIEVKPSHK